MRFLPDWSSLVPDVSPGLMAGVTVASGGLFAASLFVASWAVKRLPADYLVRSEPSRSERPSARAARIARNVLGTVLLVMGVAMLLLPGQGVLTLLAGISLMDFPGKRRFERRLMAAPKVLHALNGWRKRSGHPPLISPDDAERPGSQAKRQAREDQ